MTSAACMPSSVCVGGMRHIDHDQLGLVLVHGPQQRPQRFPTAADDLEAAPSVSSRVRPSRSRTESSAITTRMATPPVTTVGPPGGLSDGQCAIDRLDSLTQATQAAAGAVETCSAMAVVGDDNAQHVAVAVNGDLGVPGVGVLGHVRECLGDGEVGDRLDRR